MIRKSGSILFIIFCLCSFSCENATKEKAFTRKIQYFKNDSIILYDEKYLSGNIGVYDWYTYNNDGSIRRMTIFLDSTCEDLKKEKRSYIVYEFSDKGDLIYSEQFNKGELNERIIFNDSIYNTLISIDLTKGGRDTILLKDAYPACYPCPN